MEELLKLWNKYKRHLPKVLGFVVIISVIVFFIGKDLWEGIKNWSELIESAKKIWNQSGKLSLVFILILFIASIVFYVMGKQRGEAQGHVAGKAEGYKLGIADEQQPVFSRGVSEGKMAGYAEGLSAGIVQGRKEAEEGPEIAPFKPLREAFRPLEAKLSEGGLDDEKPKTVEAYADLIRAWNGLVVDAETQKGQCPIEEWRLAAHVLRSYLGKLPEQKNPFTERIFLPATFEVYALCVSDVLKTISNLRPKTKGTINVWTHFRQPLERWYNIAEGKNKQGAKYAHSYRWWEGYKDTVRSLRRTSGDVTHVVLMRRLVSLASQRGAPNLPMNVADGLFLHNQSPLSIGDAISGHNFSVSACPHLLGEVKAALGLNGQHLIFPIHLIGKCNCAQTGHANWMNFRKHFEMEYHDGVYPGESVSAGMKGVYCAYENQPVDQLLYEDVFLVDMDEINAGLFGIAYYKDRVNDLNGIVFLTDSQIKEEIQKLRTRWEHAVYDPK